MNKLYYIFLISGILFFASCSEEGADNGSTSETGQGGSLARFAVVGDFLYTVDQENMKVFSLNNEQKPVHINDFYAGFEIETIYPVGATQTLYLGSSSGMYVYDITDPSSPSKLSFYTHIRSCDPVVVEDNYAYITLSTADTWCSRGVNELQVLDVSDRDAQPVLIEQKVMNEPKGLGVDDSTLFVCDMGLKVYDVSDVNDIKFLKHFSIEANDVIPVGGLLMVIGDDGLYQYTYKDKEINYLSHIPLKQ